MIEHLNLNNFLVSLFSLWQDMSLFSQRMVWLPSNWLLVCLTLTYASTNMYLFMLAEVIHVKCFKVVSLGWFSTVYFLIPVDACEQQTKVKEEPGLHIHNGQRVAAEALLGMDSPQEENKTFLQDFLRQNQKTSELKTWKLNVFAVFLKGHLIYRTRFRMC